MIKKDLVIIGGGSGAMAAAIEAYNQGIKDILILEKDNHLGGILFQCIHAGFGLHTFKEELSGPEFASKFIDKIKEYNIEYKLETTVMEITEDKKVKYSNANEGVVLIQAKAIILACGCLERSRGAISIPGDRCSGVMSAGVAQRYLNIDGFMPGKRVFILGSGDIGLIMARRMTLEGANVLGVAELMPYSNGLNRNIQQCLIDYNIPLLLSHTVTNIIGKERLERIELSEVDDNLKPIKGTETYYDCDLLLLSVGLIPDGSLVDALPILKHPRTKGLMVDEYLQGSIPGIFSCGNGLHVHDLVDFVANEGTRSGKNAALFIKDELKTTKEKINTKAENGIGYVLPSFINKVDAEDNVQLSFRVTKPFKDVKLVIKGDGNVIKTLIKPYLLPSQMENVLVNRSLINDYKEIELEII